MSFLSPLYLIGAAAAVVPIVLHLLKRQTEQRVRFAAVALLKGAPVEHAARRRLRELLLLALRVAALVLLAVAFARPFLPGASAAGSGLTVVALDTSMSMSAPSQAMRARQLAHDAVRSAPAADDVALVTFAGMAQLVVRPTADRALVTSAIDAAPFGFGSTSYRAGLAAAGQLFTGRGGTIAVVTDLQPSGWDGGDRASVPERVRVDVKDVGELSGNLAVTAVKADGERVVVSIRNSGARSREVRARVAVDGRSAAERTVTVSAHGTADAAIDKLSLPVVGGVISATVDDPDGIRGDNTRYALADGSARSAALVVTTRGDLNAEGWYVRHALQDVRAVAAADLDRWSKDELTRVGAVVLLSTHGLEPRGRQALADYVNAGGGLLIAAGPDVDANVVADLFGAGAPLTVAVEAPRTQSLAPADVRHPVFRAFGGDIASLGLVTFRRAARVSAAPCQAIAKFTSGDAAVLDCTIGHGRAIVIASDLDDQWNDFPAHASFVPFLDQTIRYLSIGGHAGAEYVVDDVPPGVRPVPGVAEMTAAAGTRTVVVNVDPKESDGGRMTVADFEASIARLKAAGVQELRVDTEERESRQHLWQYLIAAAIVALLAEGLVARRTA